MADHCVWHMKHRQVLHMPHVHYELQVIYGLLYGNLRCSMSLDMIDRLRGFVDSTSYESEAKNKGINQNMEKCPLFLAPKSIWRFQPHGFYYIR